MKNGRVFFNGKDTQVWTVTLDCIQDQDDESPHQGENLFKLSMHLTPGGDWYLRVNGEVALGFDELPSMKEQLDQIARILRWG